VVMDVPPYCMAQGDRAELVGLNIVGLERHGFTEAQIGRIKEAYKILFRSKLQIAEALARLKAELGGNPEIDHLVDFISQSKRGVMR
jgi:UDP-N-acetylglucosamine acyltransferase